MEGKTMALKTGPQLRAGRAMAGLKQEVLAAAAGLTVNTIRRLEGMEGEIVASTTTVNSLQRALERAGIEFTDGDRPGVRMKPKDLGAAA
jgi:transcriptional regulator with XRE-family HTH domain